MVLTSEVSGPRLSQVLAPPLIPRLRLLECVCGGGVAFTLGLSVCAGEQVRREEGGSSRSR